MESLCLQVWKKDMKDIQKPIGKAVKYLLISCNDGILEEKME